MCSKRRAIKDKIQSIKKIGASYMAKLTHITPSIASPPLSPPQQQGESRKGEDQIATRTSREYVLGRRLTGTTAERQTLQRVGRTVGAVNRAKTIVLEQG